ncbi:MAG: SLOG family protein [Christensenellales bacterium]
MKEKTCFFTGHRIIPEAMVPAVKKRLQEEVLRLIGQGVTDFCAGGALGFDTLAAQAVLKLKRKYRHIRLILVLPCRGQDVKWGFCDRQTYKKILDASDEAVYMTEQYVVGCMQARNRAMAERSSHCICFLMQESGGTAYTVAVAQKLGISIVNVA